MYRGIPELSSRLIISIRSEINSFGLYGIVADRLTDCSASRFLNGYVNRIGYLKSTRDLSGYPASFAGAAIGTVRSPWLLHAGWTVAL
jgi:hypothetical protein